MLNEDRTSGTVLFVFFSTSVTFRSFGRGPKFAVTALVGIRQNYRARSRMQSVGFRGLATASRFWCPVVVVRLHVLAKLRREYSSFRPTDQSPFCSFRGKIANLHKYPSPKRLRADNGLCEQLLATFCNSGVRLSGIPMRGCNWLSSKEQNSSLQLIWKI